MTSSIAWPAVLLLAASGCAGVQPVTGMKCGKDGETRWVLHEAPHATVLTDLDEPAAREVVAAVEAAHRTLEATAFLPSPLRRLRVVAATEEGGELVPYDIPDSLKDYPTGFLVLSDEGATLVLSLRSEDPRGNVARPDGLTSRERGTIVGLVAGTLARVAIPSCPLWVAKGLGAYLQDVRVEDGRAIVGRPGREVLDLRRESVSVPMDELLGLRPCGELEHEGLRADDWMDYLLFHHLATHRTADLRSHLSRLAAGEQPGAAWNAAFPDLASQAAQEELAKRLRRGGNRREFTEAGYALAGGPPEVKRTPLGCADARLARIETWMDLGLRQRVSSEARRLLAEAPGQPVALVAQAEVVRPPERLPVLRTAIEKAPGSARGWALLAEDLPAGVERAEAARRASALGGGDPGIEVRVAEARLDEGATGEAVLLARQVVAEAPWSIRGNLALARGLARQGECGEARAALGRAEARHADQCPVRPDRNPLWRFERERMYPLPGATLEAARVEVGGCVGPVTGSGAPR